MAWVLILLLFVSFATSISTSTLPDASTKLNDIFESKMLSSQQSASRPSHELKFENIFKSAQSKRMGLEGLSSNAAAGIAPLLPNLPFLSNPFLHAGLFPWSAATTSGSLQDATREKNSERSTLKHNPFGESDLMNQLTQWQQLMALNMLSMDPMNSLFGRFANGLRPPLTTSAASLDRLRLMQQPVQSGDTSKKLLSDYSSDDPLDLSRKRPATSTPLSTSSAKSARLNAAATDGEDSEVLLADDERPIPSDASTPIVETVAKLASTKRNYSQSNLDKAVMDIRCGCLGTRRASVVYGILRYSVQIKCCKLEVAEDNGDDSSKKRRLTAYASRKKEKQLATDRTSPTSTPSTTFDGETLWAPTMVPSSGFQLTPSPQNIGSEDQPAAEDDSGDNSLLPGEFIGSLAQTMPNSAANSPSVDTSSSIAFAFSRIISNGRGRAQPRGGGGTSRRSSAPTTKYGAIGGAGAAGSGGGGAGGAPGGDGKRPPEWKLLGDAARKRFSDHYLFILFLIFLAISLCGYMSLGVIVLILLVWYNGWLKERK